MILSVVLLLISVTASEDASSTTLSTFEPTTGTQQSSSLITQSTAYRTDSGQVSQFQTTSQQVNGSTIQQTTQIVLTDTLQTTTPQKSTVLKTSESMLVTIDSAETSFPKEKNKTLRTALENKELQSVVGNPGLIAVLSVFFISVAILFVIVIMKAVHSRRPRFERLDDLPMGKINEDAPFARYPPK